MKKNAVDAMMMDRDVENVKQREKKKRSMKVNWIYSRKNIR